MLGNDKVGLETKLKQKKQETLRDHLKRELRERPTFSILNFNTRLRSSSS